MVAEIEIRQARADDRETVLAFCEHTWEWGDYVQYSWDQWLSDPAGQLLVAVADGRPVGMVHVLMLSATDAWQEGMRVDPAYRQQGIARRLSMEASAEAMRRGATTVRLLTSSTNAASIHMVEQNHFRQVGIFVPYTARPLSDTPRRQVHGLEDIRLASEGDLDEIIEYLNVSNIFPAVGGLYYQSFIGYRISDTLLREKIQADQIYLLRRWERLDGLAIAELYQSRYGKQLMIGYIDGTTESISLIAYALRQRLSVLGLDEARANVPDLMMVRDAFTGAEYTADDSTFYTYERGLA